MLPTTDATTNDLNTLYSLTDFATFGGTSTLGLDGGTCENGVHAEVHVDVGMKTGAVRDMGNLGYAAQDPIFFAHHANIDKIWSTWNGLRKPSMPAGAYQNPTDPQFLNTRWSFFDENGKTVSIAAQDVLNHEANLRYTYRVFVKIPVIPLFRIFPCFLVPCLCPGPDPILRVSTVARESILNEVSRGSPAILVLRGVGIPQRQGIFDLFATRPLHKTRILLGSVSIVGSPAMSQMRGSVTAAIDVTHSIGSLLAGSDPATLRFRLRGTSKSFPLQVESAQFRVR
jgi:hypothetical protein